MTTNLGLALTVLNFIYNMYAQNEFYIWNCDNELKDALKKEEKSF